MDLEARLKELDDAFHHVNDKVNPTREDWQDIVTRYSSFEIDREQDEVTPDLLVPFLLNYVEALIHIDEVDEAQVMLAHVPETHQDARYHFVKGFFFESVNALGAAAKHYKEAVEQSPEARTYRHLGRVHLKQEHYEEAELAYRQAVHLEPRAKSYLHLALLNNIQRKPKQALQTLQHISPEETLDQTILAALTVHTAEAHNILAGQSKLPCFAAGHRKKANNLYQQTLFLLQHMPQEQWGKDEYNIAAKMQQGLHSMQQPCSFDFITEGLQKGYLKKSDLLRANTT